MSKAAVEQLTGVLAGVKWRSPDPGSDFCIAVLESGETIKGDAPADELIPALTYRFFGTWDDAHPKYGKSFRFRAFAKSEPHSRLGMIRYLERFAPGVGPRIAGKLFDLYGAEACKILRTDPVRVALDVRGITEEKAREAAAALQEISALEDVRIDLVNLFAGRGFPHSITDQVIRRFGPLAPQRIKRDPFTLLVGEFSGAGFARCDRLYMDLGLPPGRMKRQMICLWHVLRTDNDGHTWFPVASVETKLQQHVSGVRVNLRKAVLLGIKSGWIALKKDDRGQWWVAEGGKARNEQAVADRLKLLIEGPVVLPRFAEPLAEGECDSTPDYSTEEIVERIEDESMEREIDVETLARIGRETGICQFCSRRLTNPISISYGYGPWCARKWNLPYEEVSHEAELAIA